MFESEFSRLLKNFTDEIHTRSRFVALIKDVFPGEQMKINLLISTYDLGIVKEIDNTAIINNAFAYRFVKRLSDEYGISRVHADWAVSSWCVCYGKQVLNKKCEITISSGKPGNAPSIQEEKSSGQYGDLFQYTRSTIGNGLAVCGFKGDNNRTVIFQNRNRNQDVIEIKEHSFSENTLQEAIMTEGYIKIGKNAFSGCNLLHQVILPVSLREIDDFAFMGCPSLKSITLPCFLEKIGTYSLSSSGLKTIQIPKSVYYIGDGALANCSELDNITIEENILDIPNNLFEGCSNLKKIKLHGKLSSIGREVFKDCTELQIIAIPDSVQSIGIDAFKNVNEKFIMQCSYGSYAEKYAQLNNINYQLT